MSQIVVPRDDADTIPTNAYEYLYAGTCLLKEVIEDQQERPIKQIVYNLNFKEGDDRPANTDHGASSDESEGYQATITKGSVLIINRHYISAEALFRKEIVQLRRGGLSVSSYMQESEAGLSVALVASGKYEEAADHLMTLSQSTFSDMNKSIGTLPEQMQIRTKKAMSVILDLLFTCLCKDRAVHKDVLMGIFKMELQFQDLILHSQADFYDSSRYMGQAGPARGLMRDQFVRMKQTLSDQYMLSPDKRTLDVDSLEFSTHYQMMYFANVFIRPDVDTLVDIAALAHNQDPATANIEFVRFNYKTDIDRDSGFYAAFVFKAGDEVPAFVPLCSEDSLQGLLYDEKGKKIDENELTQKLYDPESAGAATLYRLIWAPLAPFLKDMKHINYASSGTLNNISMNAVWTGNAYLLDSFDIHRFFRLKDAAYRKKNRSAPTQVSLWEICIMGKECPQPTRPDRSFWLVASRLWEPANWIL